MGSRAPGATKTYLLGRVLDPAKEKGAAEHDAVFGGGITPRMTSGVKASG